MDSISIPDRLRHVNQRLVVEKLRTVFLKSSEKLTPNCSKSTFGIAFLNLFWVKSSYYERQYFYKL